MLNVLMAAHPIAGANDSILTTINSFFADATVTVISGVTLIALFIFGKVVNASNGALAAIATGLIAAGLVVWGVSHISVISNGFNKQFNGMSTVSVSSDPVGVVGT